MEYDLLVRGGRVVDGSGLPGYVADVGVRDGKIVDIGRLKGSAARTIDAAELVVAPGFIDHHTHLDAQILWDPYGTAEPWHGVTSVVMGNCGLTLAPAKESDRENIVKSFVRVEAIPRVALEVGALGLSTNRNERHMREDGKPVGSRLATLEELYSLADVLGDLSCGVVETVVGLSTVEQLAWYDQLARRSGRPVLWQSV